MGSEGAERRKQLLAAARQIVTAGGIGAPVAQMLRAAGALVTGVDRVECPACDASILCDLGNDASLQSLLQQLAIDPPDILVNIAGVMCFGPLDQQSLAQLELCFRVNLYVPVALARAVAAPMARRGSGQVVNIGSALGAIPYPWFAAYGASKIGGRAHVFARQLWHVGGIAPLQPVSKQKAQREGPDNAQHNGPPEAHPQLPHFRREIQTQSSPNHPLAHIAQIPRTSGGRSQHRQTSRGQQGP